MRDRAFACASIAFALSVLTSTEVVAAQRTFVSASGSDINPCSLLQPCRAFAAAIALTASGGEVIVLDSAGYGPVAITQSVSLIAPAGVYAGITATNGNPGILVNGANINVTLRGLSINSVGGFGFNGIHMSDGANLTVENCVITNFDSGAGILIETAGAVTIADTVLSKNTKGVVAGFGATVNIKNSQVLKSNLFAVALFGGLAGATTNITITDTLITGNPTSPGACVYNSPNTGTTGNISAQRVTVTGCFIGFDNEPQGMGTMTISNSLVTGNSTGLYSGSGTFESLGTSQVTGNGTDISGTVTTITGK